jgi:hypothetical protein
MGVVAEARIRDRRQRVVQSLRNHPLAAVLAELVNEHLSCEVKKLRGMCGFPLRKLDELLQSHHCAPENNASMTRPKTALAPAKTVPHVTRVVFAGDR